MAEGITVRVEGLEEVERKLKLLPERIGRNAMRRALRRGANVIRDAARNNAKRIDDPETSEDIAKNIAVQGGGRSREREAGGVMMRVGVRGGAKSRKGGGTYNVGGSKTNPGGDTWYWRLVEFGTSRTRAQPFMQPAAASSAGKASSVITDAMKVELDKELAKLK